MICYSCRALLRAQHLPARILTSAPPSIRPNRLPTQQLLSQSLSKRLFTSMPARQSSREDAIADASMSAEEPSMSEAESAIADLLSSKLSPTQLLVQDVSGGCGSMYAIDITSAAFKGQSILKQQRMVNAALGDVMKSWHGVQIRTKVPTDA